MVAIFGLVDLQRIADPRPGVDMVDVEQRDRLDARLVQQLEIFRRQFVTCLDVDFAGGFVDQVDRRITTEDFLGRNEETFKAVLARLGRRARTDFLARCENNLARLGIDDVEHRLLATPVFADIGNLPATLAAHISDGVVKFGEDFFRAHALAHDVELAAFHAVFGLQSVVVRIQRTRRILDRYIIVAHFNDFAHLRAADLDKIADNEGAFRLLGHLNLERGIAKRLEQGSDGQLALPVDTDVDDVFGIEFEIEP